MNWKKIAGIVIGLAVIALIVFKLKTNKTISENKVYQYDKETPVGIYTDTLRIESITSFKSFSGQFEANKETKISAELQGKINRLWVDEGNYVKAGQTLIELDNSLLRLQLQSIDVQMEGLEKDVARFKVLAQADAIQGVQLEKAELGLKAAKVQRATLLEQIAKTNIKAPFDGIITAKFIEIGEFAAPGIPLIQLTDLSNVKFTINISENDLNLFKLKQANTITIDAIPEIKLMADVIMIGSKANHGSSFPIQFLVKNTNDLKIKSGLFGKVLIDNNENQTGILIPASAVVGSNNQPQVYLVKNGKSILQNISISQRIDNKVSVSSGLSEGDVLITSGFINLFEGANVSINN
jgi:membrane fusion protein, multidrug efflux system